MLEINGRKYIRVKPESYLDDGTPSCDGCAFERQDHCPNSEGNTCTDGKREDWFIWKEDTDGTGT